MNKFLYILKNLIIVTVPTVLLMLLILELSFRIVYTESDMPAGYFDEEDRIFLFYNKGGNGMTAGRLGDTEVNWRINNRGWNYPVDYHHRENERLIAVIGDSFIEALLINVDSNYPYLLHKMLNPEFKVYAFGKSGAPLSQYLHISRYVNKYFDPEILVINVVHNDFDESIYELYPKKHHFLQLSINEDGFITEILPQSDVKTSFEDFKWWRRHLYRSAFFRYVNRKVIAAGNRVFLRFYPTDFEANIRVDRMDNHRDSIYLAADYVVKKLREENEGRRIIFILDASRYAIYENTLSQSRVLWMHDMLADICSTHEVEFYDLNPHMEAEYKKNKLRFNSDTDGHWNEYGHRFLAEFLYRVITGSMEQ